MKFFQKRGVAITITLILIVAALLIGKPWASSNTSTASAANSGQHIRGRSGGQLL